MEAINSKSAEIFIQAIKLDVEILDEHDPNLPIDDYSNTKGTLKD